MFSVAEENKIRNLFIDFLKCDAHSIVISQLKDGVVNCYNNSNFQVTVNDKKYFVKCENPNGEILGTSLSNEMICRSLISTLEISFPVLASDAEKTIMITDYMEINRDVDLKNLAMQKKYVKLLNRLHSSKIQFPLKFCPFQIIQQYIDHSLKIGVEFPDLFFQKIVPFIKKLKKEEIFLANVPCHLDPQASNILDDGINLYLIDWECAGMCDPLFDLACMCSIEEFSESEMFEILTFYLNKQPSKSDLRRFYQMRLLADMRYCTYCYLQTKLSTSRRALFKTFADGFLDRIKDVQSQSIQ